MTQATDFKSRDAASYDALAPSFDFHTEKYSGYAIDRLIAGIDLHDGGHIVDIGCGTGVVSFALTRRAPEAKITGIDLSDGMLAFARAKAANLPLPTNLTFAKGDAEALTLEDASVDGAVSLYAWRHLPNPEIATAEVFRILRSGGRFSVAVGSGPKLLSVDGVRAALNLPVRKVAELRGRELSACAQIDRLVEQFLPPGQSDEAAAWTGGHHEFSGSLSELLARAGFRIIHSSWLGRQFDVASEEDFWDLQSTFSSVARKRISDATDADRTALRSAFKEECLTVQKNGGRLVYRVGAAIVCAEKP
ncbi:hypothetical protein BH09PSE3_BH09PSE3_00350 [soil metagenome]